MRRFRVSIRQQSRPAPLDGTVLRSLVRKALARLAPPEADLRILVVDDAAIERWNREFLCRPRPTNVLSFPDGDSPGLSGDILVSAPTCLRQTAGWPGSREMRVFFFILHGMLHLAGYDHERGGGDARRMRAAELEMYRSVLGRASR